MSQPIWLYLPINPEPWAVGPVQVRRRGGKVSAFMGRNAQLATFQEAVREELREYWEDLPTLQGKFQLRIFLWRRRDAYKTTKSRQHRKHEADATNMLKAIEDALQGVIIENDRDNLSVSSHIVEQGEDTTPGIALEITQTTPERMLEYFNQKAPGSIIKLRDKSEDDHEVGPRLSNNTWTGQEDFQ